MADRALGAILDPGSVMTILTGHARGHLHEWSLRETEYADGLTVRRFECCCGEVTFD